MLHVASGMLANTYLFGFVYTLRRQTKRMCPLSTRQLLNQKAGVEGANRAPLLWV